MITLKTEIVNEGGLNMRSSMKVMEAAILYKSNITIEREDISRSIDAKSIMAIASIAASKGTLLTVKADGEDEQEAAHHLKNLINGGIGEI